MTPTGTATWSNLSPGEIEELSHTDSPAMRRALKDLQAVAPTRTTVLLTGETGTGKGLMARLLHHLSRRREMSFAAVHCGAIPDTLLESELFGHEKGAFTGALRRKAGRFEAAKGGTLFLDEIGTITPAAQIKLLHVLQDRVFQRVGGNEDIEPDIRLVAATNEDLKSLTEEGTFRRDLYYRINVFSIDIPPLRHRREDMAQLVRNILLRHNGLYGKEIRKVHPEVLRAFRDYSWPGNVRELENLMERAHILEATTMITPDSIPAEIFSASEPVASVPVDPSRTLAAVRREAITSVERRYLTELLAANEGRIGAAARAAGITPRQLHKLLTRHGIRKELFKRPEESGTGDSDFTEKGTPGSDPDEPRGA